MKELIRYKNRKIYDSDTQKYVTLAEITEMLLNGLSVTITEYETGANLTSYIYSTVLTELTKTHKVPAQKILEIIQNCVDETGQQAVQ